MNNCVFSFIASLLFFFSFLLFFFASYPLSFSMNIFSFLQKSGYIV